jgi:all-trans-retinol 13,14-reductase
MQKIAIIGGGLGGLTAGALLAKKGYRVTLLEQHSIVGGCASVFKRGAFTCEVGLHEMNGVHSDPQINEIFKKLGVYENVTFVKPNEFFRVVTKRGEFVMPHTVQAAKTALKKLFESEHVAIDAYFALIENVSKKLQKLSEPGWMERFLFPFKIIMLLKYKNKSVAQILDTLTQNEELKLILNANVGYYNDTPHTLHAVAQYSYFTGGGWFIQGGSFTLSIYLASVITQNGGEVITNANVIKAAPNEVGYMCRQKYFSKSVDAVVSNISPQDTYKLFGVLYKEEQEISPSLTTLYLGFSKNIQELYPQGRYSNFFLDDLTSQEDFTVQSKKESAQKNFVFVDYSRINAELTGKDKSFGVVCMLDTLQAWEDLDKETYKKKKEQTLKNVLKRLERHYPDLHRYVEYAEMATPKTMRHFLKTPNATAYGYKPTPQRFFQKPKVRSDKVDNLYFAGQFVIAGGFSPTIISGYLCFEAIHKAKKRRSS